MAIIIDKNVLLYYSHTYRLGIEEGIMAIIKKEQKETTRNVLLRVSVPAPLIDEIKKVKRLCKDNGYYFDIKPDVISAVEKALEEARIQLQKEKNKY
jgi:hypothetical protein